MYAYTQTCVGVYTNKSEQKVLMKSNGFVENHYVKQVTGNILSVKGS